MAESQGLWLIDGENAGSTPWEFDSVTEGGSCTFALDSSAANNGTYGYKATFDGADSDCYATKSYSYSTSNDFYLRFYIYIPSGMNTNDLNAYVNICTLRDGASNVVYLTIKGDGVDGTPHRWRAALAGVGGNESSNNFTMDAWHYIEVHYVQDASSGGCEVWVDGDSLYSSLGNDTSSLAVDNVYIGNRTDISNTYLDTSGDYIYFDDIKSDSSAIGAYSPQSEGGGVFLIDGEGAGSTPWEFDSIEEDGSNTFALAAAAANNGSYGYKSTFDGTNDGACGLLNNAFSTPNDFYLRFYIYVPSGQTISPVHAYVNILALRDGASNVFYMHIKGDAEGDPYRWRVMLAGLDGHETSTNFSEDAWHWVEVHWVSDSAAGGAQVWVDGDSIYSNFTYDTAASEIDKVYIGSLDGMGNAIFDTSGDYIYYDDIKADTSYIGEYISGVEPELIASAVSESLVLADLSGGTAAGQWFVDNTASGANDGTSWTNAWESLGDIDWGSVSPGETIYVSGGTNGKTYTGQINPSTSGELGNPITIRTASHPEHHGDVTIATTGGSSNVRLTLQDYITIDGFKINGNADGTTSENPCRTSHCTGIIYKNLTIVWPMEGGVNKNRYNECIKLYRCHDCLVQDCFIWTGEDPISGFFGTDGVYLQEGTGNTVDGCTIKINNHTPGAHLDPIQCANSTDVTIRNNWLELVHENDNGQILVKNVRGTTRIYNNVMIGSESQPYHCLYYLVQSGYENQSYLYLWNNFIYGRDPNNGRAIHQPESRAEIKNNIFQTVAGNTFDGAGKNGTFSHNCYYREDGGALGHSLTTGEINDNPDVDANYNLTEGSPCINAGTPIGYFSDDRHGTSRPQDGSWDIGPAEYPAPEPLDIGGAEIVAESTVGGSAETTSLIVDPTALRASLEWPYLRSAVYADMSGGTPVRGYSPLAFSRHRVLQRFTRSP